MFSGNKVKPWWARDLSESEYTGRDLAGALPTAGAQETCVCSSRDRGWEKMHYKDTLSTSQFSVPSRCCLPNTPVLLLSFLHEKRCRVSGKGLTPLTSDWVLFICPFGWPQSLILGTTMLCLWRFSFHRRHLDCRGLWWFKGPVWVAAW